MATLETRISDMEKKAGMGAGAPRLERIRLVGVNRDGSEGQSVVIKIPPTKKGGHMDFSNAPPDR